MITRGEKGSIAIKNNEIVEFGVEKLKIIDLTGAGDLFAGFLHGQINNLTPRESLEKGTEMSSKIIQRLALDFLKFFFCCGFLSLLGFYHSLSILSR